MGHPFSVWIFPSPLAFPALEGIVEVDLNAETVLSEDVKPCAYHADNAYPL